MDDNVRSKTPSVNKSNSSSLSNPTPLRSKSTNFSPMPNNNNSSNNANTSNTTNNIESAQAGRKSDMIELEFMLGDRVYIRGDERRRGKVRYIGYPVFSTGLWVGIEFPTPMGKNDGSVQG